MLRQANNLKSYWYLEFNFKNMNNLVIDKKKYIIIARKDYDLLQKKAALKIRPEKTLTLVEARIYSKSLIHKWAREK